MTHPLALTLQAHAEAATPCPAAALAEAAELIQALEQEAREAVQVLIDVIQHFDGQVAPDWSSYRVSFGYGVCRGTGSTPGQQIASAARECLGLKVPPAFTVRPRGPQ